MTTVPPKQRDWLEPPEWWKKWRPLRWLAGLLVLTAILSWVLPLFSPGDSAQPEAPPPAVAASDGDPGLDDPQAGGFDAEPETASGPDETAALVDAKTTPDAASPAVAPAVPAPQPASSAAALTPPTAAKTPEPKKPESKPADKKPAAVPPPKPVVTAVAPAPAPAAAPETVAVPPAVTEDDKELETLEAQASQDYRAYTERLPNPVGLMTAFRSYSSVDAVHGALKAAQYEPVQESNHSKVRAGVPPRNLDLMRVKAYRHLGVSGVLELQFFNDRLAQAEFQPDAAEAEAYRDALRRALPQLPRERSGRSELRDGSLRVASSLDLALSEVGAALRTRPFVLWQDLRLIEQRDNWDQRFGTKAN